MRPRDVVRHKGEEVLVIDAEEKEMPLPNIAHLVGRHCRLVGGTEEGLAEVLFKGRKYKIPPSRIEFSPDGA